MADIAVGFSFWNNLSEESTGRLSQRVIPVNAVLPKLEVNVL